ncbi:MAG TPA: hypothetical protein VMY39_00385 [Planctomycetota bacterium]|nr:hypothetical protein [Planctomycetota bacterium]
MTLPREGQVVRTRGRLWLSALAVLLLFLAALAVLWPFVPGTMGNVDAATKLWQVESFVHGQLPLTYRAAALDPDCRFVPTLSVALIDGKPYAMYLNLFTGLLFAGYHVFGRLSWQVVPMLFALGTIGLTTGFARRHRLVPDRDLWLLVLVLGFCTPLVTGSVIPLEPVLAGTLAMGALLLAGEGVKVAREGGRGGLVVRFVGAGVCLGLAPLARPECYALALAVGLATVVVLLVMKTPVRWCVVSGAALAAGGGLVLGVVYLVFPLVFRIQVALNTQNLVYSMPMYERVWRFLLCMTPGTAASRVVGVRAAEGLAIAGMCLLAAALVTALVSGVRRSWPRHLAAGLFLAALACILPCWGLDGVFVALPLVGLLFFLRGEPLLRDPAVTLVLASAVVFVALLVLLLPNAGGDTLFSPRYLLPVTVPVSAAAFCLVRTHLARSRGRWLRVLLVASVAVTCTGLVKGLMVIRRSASISKASDARLATLPGPLLFCTDTHQAHRVGVLYHAPHTLISRRVLRVDSEPGFMEVVDIFRRNGIDTFTLVGFTALLDRDLDLVARAGGTVVEKLDFDYGSVALVVTLKPGADGLDTHRVPR